MSPLYNSDSIDFYDDLEKILFNEEGKQGERNKRSKGKLVNLNTYIEKE